MDKIKQLSEMYDNVEKEFQRGEISADERDIRQKEIMDTWRMIQP